MNFQQHFEQFMSALDKSKAQHGMDQAKFMEALVNMPRGRIESDASKSSVGVDPGTNANEDIMALLSNVLKAQKDEIPPEKNNDGSSTADLMKKHTGVIKNYIAAKGFGFITSAPQSTDLFFHVSNIQNFTEALRNDLTGREVNFDLGTDKKSKPIALNIRLTETSNASSARGRHEAHASEQPTKKKQKIANNQSRERERANTETTRPQQDAMQALRDAFSFSPPTNIQQSNTTEISSLELREMVESLDGDWMLKTNERGKRYYANCANNELIYEFSLVQMVKKLQARVVQSRS